MLSRHCCRVPSSFSCKGFLYYIFLIHILYKSFGQGRIYITHVYCVVSQLHNVYPRFDSCHLHNCLIIATGPKGLSPVTRDKYFVIELVTQIYIIWSRDHCIQPGSLARSCNVATDRLVCIWYQDVCGLSATEPRPGGQIWVCTLH